MHWLSSFLALIDQTSELGASRISPQLSSNTSPWLLSWQLPSSIWRLGWISQNVALHWKKNMHHTPWLECWWPIFWPVASHKQIISLVLHGHLMSWQSDLFAHCDQSQQNALHKQSLHPCNLICLECNHQWIHYSNKEPFTQSCEKCFSRKFIDQRFPQGILHENTQQYTWLSLCKHISDL